MKKVFNKNINDTRQIAIFNTLNISLIFDNFIPSQ